MIFKKDHLWFGIVLGLIAPLAGMLLFKYYKFQELTMKEMFEWIKLNPHLISAAISFSLLFNAILFTVYVNRHKDKTAKGLFVVTVAFAIVAFIYKYY